MALTSAHIKGYYSPALIPVRNAPSLKSDGSFSTGGACGGSNEYKANGESNFQVVDGQKLCLRINYNGGHRTPSNKFRAVFRCTHQEEIDERDDPLGPGRQALFNTLTPLTLLEGTSPAPDADNTHVSSPTGNEVTAGYNLCFNLPNQGLDALKNASVPIPADDPRRQCAVSLLDQRNWGTCFDLLLADADGTVPVATLPPERTTENQVSSTVALGNSVGVYKITACDRSSGGKCCMKGHVAISKDGFAVARMEGETLNHCKLLTSSWDYHFSLKQDKLDPALYTGQFNMDVGFEFTQTMELNVRDEAAEVGAAPILQVSNVGVEEPDMADVVATQIYTSVAQGVEEGLVPHPDGGAEYWTTIIVGTSLTFFFLFILFPMLYTHATGGGFRHPWVCGRDRGGSSSALTKGNTDKAAKPIKKGWAEAQDEEGEIYYYNKKTKEVSWDRP